MSWQDVERETVVKEFGLYINIYVSKCLTVEWLTQKSKETQQC